MPTNDARDHEAATRNRLHHLARLLEVLRLANPDLDDERLSRLALDGTEGAERGSRSAGAALLENARELSFARSSSAEWTRSPFAALARGGDALVVAAPVPGAFWGEHAEGRRALAAWWDLHGTPGLALFLHAVAVLHCLPPELDEVLCLPAGRSEAWTGRLVEDLGLLRPEAHGDGKSCWPAFLRIHASRTRHPSCRACCEEARRMRLLAGALAELAEERRRAASRAAAAGSGSAPGRSPGDAGRGARSRGASSRKRSSRVPSASREGATSGRAGFASVALPRSGSIWAGRLALVLVLFLTVGGAWWAGRSTTAETPRAERLRQALGHGGNRPTPLPSTQASSRKVPLGGAVAERPAGRPMAKRSSYYADLY